MNEYLDLIKSGRNQWYFYLITALLVIISTILGYFPQEWYLDSANTEGLSAQEIYIFQESTDYAALGLNSSIGLMTLIAGFAFGLLALFLLLKYLHQRSFWTLINPFSNFRWDRIWFGLAFWAVCMTLMLVFDLFYHTESFSFRFNWSSFLPLLLVCLIALPIQTSFEELVFRGYLMQAFSLIAKRPIVTLVATSILFVVVHLGNPEIDAYGWYVMCPYYFGTAFTFGLITLMDKGIELALAVHAMNNIFGALTVTYGDAVIQTDAMWTRDLTVINIWTVMSYFIFYGILIYFVYRRYMKPSLDKLD